MGCAGISDPTRFAGKHILIPLLNILSNKDIGDGCRKRDTSRSSLWELESADDATENSY